MGLLEDLNRLNLDDTILKALARDCRAGGKIMICPTCQGTLETCGHLHRAGTVEEIAGQHQALIDGGFLPARGESPIQTVQKHLAAFDVKTCHGVPSDAPSLIRDVGRLVPCPVCRTAWTAAGLSACSRCRRLEAVGRIVAVLDLLSKIDPTWGLAVLKGLDAVADLLTDHAITARDHRRELNGAIRDAQDGARESYVAGVWDERERNER